MKICVINNLYEPFIKGGAERVVENIIHELISKNHEIFLITTKPYFKKTPKNQAIKIYYINSWYFRLDKIPKIFRLFWHISNLFSLFSYLKIKKILKKEKPKIVMSHNLEGIGFLTPLAIKKLKIKHIHTLHDMQLLHPSGLMIYGEEKVFSNWSSKIYQKITRQLFKSINTIVSPSDWLIKEYKNKIFFSNSKNITITNPIKLNNENIEKSKKFSETNILYVGQIGAYKGINLLVDVFLELNCDTNLIILGSGKDEKKLKSKVREVNNIKFLGRKSKREVEKFMLSSDFLVVPSLCYENSPSVIYEAASVGLPVIASRIGGITELVHYLGGVLFCPGDKNDLKNKIFWAIKNPLKLKKIGERSKKNINNLQRDNYIDSILSS